MKLTPWFPCSIKPVISGEYDVRLWDGEHKEYAAISRTQWDGKYWSWCNERQSGVNRPGWHKKDQWRGLAEKPK